METEVIADDLRISQIGLGGWELRGGATAGGEPSIAAARAVIDAAVFAGVNWIDTAEIYFAGRNERLIGDCLSGRDMLVSTKLGPRPEGSGFLPAEIEEGLHRSRARLRRDVIDICFLHWPDEQTTSLARTWEALCGLADRGFVRALGLSNFGLSDIQECHALRPVDVVQVGLSLVDRLSNLRLIRGCRDLGIPVVIYEPLANGILTDKNLSELGVTWGVGFQDWDCYERLLAPHSLEQTCRAVEQVRLLAAENDVTTVQLALAWVLGVPGVSAAIVGTTRPHHVLEGVAAATLSLDPATVKTLDAIAGLDRASSALG